MKRVIATVGVMLLGRAGCGGSGGPNGGGGGAGGGAGGGSAGSGGGTGWGGGMCGNGTCDPGEGPASCPGDCGCAAVTEHGIIGGIDTASGVQAHFWRGGEDVVEFVCPTRGPAGVAITSTWSSGPCLIRINGGFLTTIPGATTSYCWSDGVSGVSYTSGANGYQTSPPDGTVLTLAGGVPQIENRVEGWAVTFSDQTTGAANVYTDMAGNPAWHRGQTKFVNDDGSWNGTWIDNMTWSTDPSMPGWTPLAYGGHTTTAGVGTDGFVAGNLTATTLSLHFATESPGTVSISQVPSQAGGNANGLAVTVTYDGAGPTALTDVTYYDVRASDGNSYSWNQQSRVGEYLTDTPGTDVYSGTFNSAVMAEMAVPPSATNGWADPGVTQTGKYPLSANGMKWSRNQKTLLGFGSDAQGNLDEVDADDGYVWKATFDGRRRLKNATETVAGTQTEAETIDWDPNVGRVATETVTSFGSTTQFAADYSKGGETPGSVTLKRNGQVVSSVVPMFTTAANGYPVLQNEKLTINEDDFGGNQAQSATFVFTYPQANQVNIDESGHNVHLRVTEYADGRFKSISGSSPWLASGSASVTYGPGGVPASEAVSAQAPGGPTQATSATLSLKPQGLTVGSSVTYGATKLGTSSNSLTWDGGSSWTAQRSGSYLGLSTTSTVTLPTPLGQTSNSTLTGPAMLAGATKRSCSIDASHKVACTSTTSADGDAVAGTQTENQ